MTPEEQLPDELAVAYLELLGLELEPGTVDAAALARLHAANLAHVPYETIDIVRGHPPTIDPVASVRRIVGGRGGYCYHLNGAFSALLGWLRVDVTRHLAGVQRRGDEAPGANGNHLGLTARTADGREWLVDVGTSDGPARPLPLIAGEHRVLGYSYRLRRSSVGTAAWRFDHDDTGSFAGFDMESRVARMDEFAAMHARLATQSHFARTVVVGRRTDDRLESLRGCTFTERTPLGVSTSELADSNAWWDVVLDHFGLAYRDLSAAERSALWSKVIADHEAWQLALG